MLPLVSHPPLHPSTRRSSRRDRCPLDLGRERGAGVDNGKRAAAAIGSEEIDEGSLADVRPDLRCTKLVSWTSEPGDAFVVRWRGEGSSKGEGEG
jgi:hypothetical protein